MNKNYVIHWKSTVNGRAGRGTKLFDKKEAEQLVEELNREYPQIQHEVAAARTASTETLPESESVDVPLAIFTPTLAIA
jgi:hypothetical protein